MNFRAMRNVVTSKAGRQILRVQKHSPAILFGAGVVGVVGTVVLACRATLRVEEVLDEHQDKANMIERALVEKSGMYDESDAKRDRVVLYTKTSVSLVKLYAPAILLGAASIGALTGAHLVLNRRNVALTAAYAAVEKGFAEYRKRVVDEFGEDKDRELRYGLVDKQIVEEDEHGTVVTTVKGLASKDASMYARFFDESNKNWERAPHYNQMFIQCQQTWANDLLKGRGHVFLNEVYDMLGFDRTPAGAVVGWVKDNCEGIGDNHIDFGVFDGDLYNATRFVNGDERSILLDFNVDGVIYDKI